MTLLPAQLHYAFKFYSTISAFLSWAAEMENFSRGGARCSSTVVRVHYYFWSKRLLLWCSRFVLLSYYVRLWVLGSWLAMDVLALSHRMRLHVHTPWTDPAGSCIMLWKCRSELYADVYLFNFLAAIFALYNRNKLENPSNLAFCLSFKVGHC